MVQVNWDMLDRGMERTSRQIADITKGTTDAIKQHGVRRAVDDYQADPKNTNAISYLYSVNPSLASSLEKSSQERAELGREGEARSAFSGWLLSQGGPRTNALAGHPSPNPVPPAPPLGGSSNALNAPQNAPRSSEVGIPQATMPGPVPSSEIGVADVGAQPNPMDRGQGQQFAPGDPNWERYVRADPSGAMKSMLSQQSITKAQNEALFTRMDLMARLARGAVDQPSYDAAIQRAQSMGIDTSSMPPQFDPAAVNAIELQALSAKEHLTEQRNERRLDWDMEDDQIDNQRDARNVGSQISTRQGQLANTRRGQDVADARGRRGQDLSDARGRRGQDMNDRRVRQLRGSKVRGKPITNDEPMIRMPDGRIGVVRGNRYVDAKTGQPL